MALQRSVGSSPTSSTTGDSPGKNRVIRVIKSVRVKRKGTITAWLEGSTQSLVRFSEIVCVVKIQTRPGRKQGVRKDLQESPLPQTPCSILQFVPLAQRKERRAANAKVAGFVPGMVHQQVVGV